MENITYRPIWGKTGSAWGGLSEDALLFDVGRGLVVETAGGGEERREPRLFRMGAEDQLGLLRGDLGDEQVGELIEGLLRDGEPQAVGAERVGAGFLGPDVTSWPAGPVLQVGEGLAGGSASFGRALDRARALALLEVRDADHDVSAIGSLLDGSLDGLGVVPPSRAGEVGTEPSGKTAARRLEGLYYDPVNGIAIESCFHDTGLGSVKLFGLDLPSLARFAEERWSSLEEASMCDLLMLDDTPFEGCIRPAAAALGLDGVEFERLASELGRSCARTGTFVELPDVLYSEYVYDLIDVTERAARGRYPDILGEPVTEWWDRTHPAQAGRLDDLGALTFDDVLGEVASGRLDTVFARHPEAFEGVIGRLAETTGVDRGSLLDASSVTRGAAAETDMRDLEDFRSALAGVSDSLPRLSDAIASSIGREAETADVLRAYDSYITAACEARLFDTGWMPVGVAEFRENEYVNCWKCRTEGEDPFGWMHDGAGQGRGGEAGEARLETPVGTLRATVDGEAMVVDLDKPDGTSGQIAYIEATRAGEERFYPTPLHVFTFDGDGEWAAYRTDVRPDGPAMQYEPRRAAATAVRQGEGAVRNARH